MNTNMQQNLHIYINRSMFDPGPGLPRGPPVATDGNALPSLQTRGLNHVIRPFC